MKNKNIVSLLLLLLLSLTIVSCSTTLSSLKVLHGSNTKELAILIAIDDFSQTSLFKKDSVFSIKFHDTVYKKAIWVADEKGTYYPYTEGYYPELVAVTIIGEENKYYYNEKENKIYPNRYVIFKGKLFCWYDKKYPKTDKIIEVLRAFNMLQSEDPWSFTTDDSKKGADYYLYKNNLSKYKRIITNIAIGFYDPPIF